MTAPGDAARHRLGAGSLLPQGYLDHAFSRDFRTVITTEVTTTPLPPSGIENLGPLSNRSRAQHNRRQNLLDLSQHPMDAD